MDLYRENASHLYTKLWSLAQMYHIRMERDQMDSFKVIDHPKNTILYHLLTLMSFQTWMTFTPLWNTHNKRDMLKFVLFIHKMKVSGVQYWFGPHWLSLHGQKQLKHSLKYLLSCSTEEGSQNGFGTFLNEYRVLHHPRSLDEHLCFPSMPQTL